MGVSGARQARGYGHGKQADGCALFVDEPHYLGLKGQIGCRLSKSLLHRRHIEDMFTRGPRHGLPCESDAEGEEGSEDDGSTFHGNTKDSPETNQNRARYMGESSPRAVTHFTPIMYDGVLSHVKPT